MHPKKTISTAFSAGLFVLAMVSITQGVEINDKLSLGGWGWVTMGRFESAYLDSSVYESDFDNLWIEDVHLGLKFVGKPTSKTTLCLHAGGFIQQTASLWNYSGVSVGTLIKPYMVEASIQGDFSTPTITPFDLKFGYFTAHYNHMNKNLGEYLFDRTRPFPPVVTSGFELEDKAKVLGLRLRHPYVDSLWGEGYFTSEIRSYPFYDFSLAYLLHYRPSPVFRLSAGVNASRLIPVDLEATEPARDTTRFNLRTPEFNLVAVEDDGDTIYLTHSGWKAMLHFGISPLAKFDGELLGKNDFSVYAEAAILGIENYPVWYEDRTERMPVMFGVHLPRHPLMGWGAVTALSAAGAVKSSYLDGRFHIPGSAGAAAAFGATGVATWALNHFLGIDTWLDTLALEAEYFGNPYISSVQAVVDSRSPVPYTSAQIPEYERYVKHHENDWKWSLYASKRIGSFFRISGQIANDNIGRGRYGAKVDYPVTFKPEDWYWALRAFFYM